MKYILIHGLGQSSSSWKETISFMDQTNQVLHPDLFTLLEDKEHTYNNLYIGLSEYINECSEPVALIGLSLGAILALHYTIEHPQKVDSLIVIGAQFRMPKGLLRFQNIIFRVMPESTFKKLGSSKKDFIQLTTSMMELDFSKDLHRVSCKTLVLCGDKDRANKKAAIKLSEQISNAEMQTITGVGHEVNIEAPEKLAFFLNDFLKKNEVKSY